MQHHANCRPQSVGALLWKRVKLRADDICGRKKMSRAELLCGALRAS